MLKKFTFLDRVTGRNKRNKYHQLTQHNIGVCIYNGQCSKGQYKIFLSLRWIIVIIEIEHFTSLTVANIQFKRMMTTIFQTKKDFFLLFFFGINNKISLLLLLKSDYYYYLLLPLNRLLLYSIKCSLIQRYLLLTNWCPFDQQKQLTWNKRKNKQYRIRFKYQCKINA